MARHLEHLERIVVVAGGAPSPRGVHAAGAYIGGWLASRLGLVRERGRFWYRDGRFVLLECRPAPGSANDIALLRLETRQERDQPIAFVAAAQEHGLVHLSVETEHACPLPRILRLPERGTDALLCGVLQQSGADSVFEAALAEAASLDHE
jgi:hypothetical protein